MGELRWRCPSHTKNGHAVARNAWRHGGEDPVLSRQIGFERMELNKRVEGNSPPASRHMGVHLGT